MQAGCHGSEGGRRSCCRGRLTQAELLTRCAARWPRRRGRRRIFPACRCSAVWWAIRRTTWCATSSACPRARHDFDGTPDAHYVAPASHAGVRSSDAQHGVAACRSAKPSGSRCARKSSAHCAAACRPAGKPARYSAADGLADARPNTSHGVKRMQEYIAAGDVYQLVLASRFSGRCELDPFEAYRALRLLNPSPYMYYCDLGDHRGGFLARSAGASSNGGHAQLRPHCRHAAARSG